ncbi:L-lactate permease [Effusibacillus consociatus]|uniref:L-lactate permease n=1 Tax=Effusibacillus consociatus TaxID=1117041 RepID=A0ABV9PUC2_9BACL
MAIAVSLLPILVIFLCLFILKQSALRAGVIGYLTAVIIPVLNPQFGLEWPEIGTASVKGILISSIVAYVLLSGIFLFHLMNQTGAIKSIATFVSNSTSDPVRQVLMLVVAFSPFVESVSGFGIAIIVTAPILIELGFDRFRAALLSLLGLSAVPWGALASGTVIGSSLGGIPLQTLGAGSAILAVPTFFYFSIVAVLLARGWKGFANRWFECTIVTCTLAGSVWFFSTFISVELAGVLGALAAMGAEWFFIRSAAGASKAHGITKALSPYLFLTGALFITRLIPAAKDLLTTHLVLEFPNYSFRLPLLYSPGFAILITCLFTIGVFKVPKLTIRKALHSTLKQWIPVTLSTAAFSAMSEVMSASGMTAVLAGAAAFAFGSSFLLVSPLIGATGGYLTGSNTGANAMFIKLQIQTAAQLGISPEILAIGQNTSASHMTMASPSRVLLGVSVCGIHSEENKLVKKIALIALGALILVLIGMLWRS